MNVLSLGATAGIDPLKSVLGGDSHAAGKVQYELRIGTFVQGELSVVSFEGHEKLSAPYEYDVDFSASVPAQLLQMGVFGFPACLSIMTPTEPKVIQGLAVSFECVGAAEAEVNTNTRRYSTKIVPRLWLLNHNRRNRIFQDMSAVEIACAILDGAGITYKVSLERDEYPPIPFMYQRGETDLEFLHHVLATAGIFYFFEHATGLLEELLPGAGAAGALLGGLGGMASGAASLGGSVGIGGASASLGGGLGGAVSGALGAVGAVAGAATAVATALGAVTTLVLCDGARHTHAMHASSLSGAADAAVGAAIGAVGDAVGSLGGSIGGSMMGGSVDVGGLASGGLAGVVSAAIGGGLGEALVYDANGDAAAEAERVFSFRVRKEVRPKRVMVQDWNLERSTFTEQASDSAAAKLDVSAGLTALVGASGLGAAAGLNVDLNVDALPIATKDVAVAEYQRDGSFLSAKPSFSDRALAQVRGDWIVGRGETDSRRIAAGYRFTLARHPISGLNTEYVVTELSCRGSAPDHLPADTTPIYASTFSTVPTSLDPRPPKPGPPAYGAETARVVGPVNGDVFCDELGRILVRFRWAPPTKAFSETDEGLCWVHWLERLAGDGYGTLTLPRVGSEVLLQFLRQEGGRPVAVGQFYSTLNAPPFSLPGEANKLGIRSTVGSEFVLDDATGNIHVRAHNDHSTEVSGNQRIQVTGQRRLDVSSGLEEYIGGSLQQEVAGDTSRVVGGSARLKTAVDEFTEVGGNVEVDVRGSLHRSVANSVSERVGGAMSIRVAETLNLDVQQSQTTNIRGAETRTIGARQVVTVGSGASPAECDISVYGKYRLACADEIILEAGKSLVLRCAGTEIRLTPETLAHVARSVLTTATKQLTLSGAGPSLTFGDTMEFSGKKVILQSTGARLELSDEAQLVGSKVRLSKSGAAATSSDSDDTSLKTISLTLVDEDDAALANCQYHLRAGGILIEGHTDSSGAVQAKVPKEAVSARLTVWPEAFPEGRRITYILNLGTVEDANDLAGAQKRLGNLGIYRGQATGQMNMSTRDALLVFQFQKGLPTTGLLDDATASKLAEVHP
jgi:uncharacterized protein involved in type VI secretion and phage assembly